MQLRLINISTTRLSSYRDKFQCIDDAGALKYYYWNQSLSSELYILLHNIEVCLRNSIHIALSKEVSKKITGEEQTSYPWYKHFNFIDNVKRPNSLNKTGEAIRLITHKNGVDLNLPPHTVVSSLEFGKWKYILKAKRYDDNTAIEWDKIYPLIFPNFKNHRSPHKRDEILKRLDNIRNWRNRVAHLEPAWKFKDVKNETGKVKLHEPKNKSEIKQRLNSELRRSLDLLNWLCIESYNFYIATKSYQRLLILTQLENVEDFEL